mgnify:CR=1 FL=1
MVGNARFDHREIGNEHGRKIAGVAPGKKSQRELPKMFRQRDTPRRTHFVGSSEIGPVGGPFGQSHHQHINGQYAENAPQPCRVERFAAAVECGEDDAHRLDGEAKRYDIDQIGEHGIATGL